MSFGKSNFFLDSYLFLLVLLSIADGLIYLFACIRDMLYLHSACIVVAC
jgi:hypothetical protein